MRKRVLSGDVELCFVQIDQQAADIFTKALDIDKLKQFFENRESMKELRGPGRSETNGQNRRMRRRGSKGWKAEEART